VDEYSYEYEGDRRYCYPGSSILINLLNITDSSFNEAERRFTAITTLEVMRNPVPGKFDLKHLMSIHKAIFGGIFVWAGKLREVNISKGNQFCQSAYLVDCATELFAKLKDESYLATTTSEEFPIRLAYYLSEINVLHPFREGNGRTQRMFIDYLARYNGYHLNFSNVSGQEMIEASALAFNMNYSKLEAIVLRAIEATTVEERDAFRKAIKMP